MSSPSSTPLSDDLLPLSGTPRTTLKRHPERTVTDRAALYALIDQALVGEIATIVDGSPRILPFVPWRVGDEVFIHGHLRNAIIAAAAEGTTQCCMSITMLDGLVLARSAFNHSVNFRSAVVFGKARLVTDLEEKATVLQAMMDKVTPDRAADVRAANTKELNATAVLGLSLAEASLKMQATPYPKDAAEDYAVPVWAGIIPYTLVAGTPIPDPNTAPPQS